MYGALAIVAVAVAAGVTGAAAAARPEDGPGGNPACFRGAREQPTTQPSEGTTSATASGPTLPRGLLRRDPAGVSGTARGDPAPGIGRRRAS